MLELYKRIRSRREELGMSQEDLAKKMGYKSRSSINKIEMGENDIPQSKILQFADALDTTPGYLMGWHENEEKPTTVSDDGLSAMKRAVIEQIKLLDEDTVVALAKIADSILAARDK